MNWLKVLVAFSALLVAGCAAYFSVTGLGVLFSGASIAVMVMAGSLEFAKLVAASYLKQKWDDIQILFKIYLTTAVVILMVITSAGIFGYLSNAFQQQNLKIDQVTREISVWEQKIEQTDKEIDRYNKQLEGQIKIRESQEENIRTSTSAGRSVSRYSDMVKRADSEITRISNKITELNESNAKSYEEINKIKNANIEVEREVGGFRFVADAFGLDLNYVVKLFIFLIVFVFDPLALALVIAFNQMANKKKVETKKEDNKLYEVYGDEGQSLEDADDTDDIVDLYPPNDKLIEAAKQYKKEVQEKSEVESSNTLDAIKEPSVEETEFIEEPIAKSSGQARAMFYNKPYYARPDFDWSNKANWINDQNAVNYWLKYKRREQEGNDENVKTY